jgi:hypothetical protein
MPSLGQALVRSPATATPQDYARRVHLLAFAYVVLFVAALTGFALIIWQGRLLVTLSQRSNVETLTLAFFLVFFGYMIVLSAPGAWGAVHIAFQAARRRFDPGAAAAERPPAAAGTGEPEDPPVGALNLIVEHQERPGQPLTLRVADAAGAVGTLEINGAELIHHDHRRSGSNSLLAFAVEQINQIMGDRLGLTKLDIVSWKMIDDEQTEAYLGQVRFARNLERHLGAEELWPKLRLSDADCQELERRLAAICPALRDEASLPDWEYQAEHKLPLIPEPLGLASLSRVERRADPVASIGCGVIIVLLAVAVLGLLILFPPWVPGA